MTVMAISKTDGRVLAGILICSYVNVYIITPILTFGKKTTDSDHFKWDRVLYYGLRSIKFRLKNVSEYYPNHPEWAVVI